MSDWGQGAKNNNIGWGQGAVNNSIDWGSVHENSWSGDTDIVGLDPIETIINAFEERVALDGGTFEAESCLNTTLTELNNEGLLEEASLVITPNAVEEGKLFSIKPTDGSGDLSVVRATTKTRVNSLGVIESVPINVASLDYSNGSCPSILVEPQRTNLITFSEDFAVGQASYNNASVLVNTDISPNGTLTADKVTFNGDFSAVRKNFTYLAGTTYTISFYAKRVSGVDSFIMFDSTNSVTIATFNFTNEWVRYTGTFTPAITSTLLFWVRIGGGSTSANTFLIWGAQLEVGANATSYIPTLASAVTRNADVISKTGISDLIGQTEGVLFVESQLPAVSESSIKTLFALSLDASNRMTCYASNSSLTYVDTKAGINQEVYNFNFASILGQTLRFAVKWSPNQTKIFINGSLVRTYNLNPAVGFNSLRIGISAFSTASWDGLIRQNILFPLLTDVECIQLTTL
jgi:hypothetical protein